MLSVVLLASCVVLTGAAQLVFRAAVRREATANRRGRTLGITLGLALNGLGAVLWLLTLSRVDLSLALPVLGLNLALVPAAAGWLLNERLTGRQWAGVVMIVAGVLLVAVA